MNFIFRAAKSLKERIGKTIIIFAVMLTVCIVILAGFSIKSATEKAAILARQELGATVTLSVDQQKLMESARKDQSSAGDNSSKGNKIKISSTPVPLDYLDELKDSKYVIGYTVTSTTNVNVDGINQVGQDDSEEVESEQQQESHGGMMMPSGDKMQGSMSFGDFSLVVINDFNSINAVLEGSSELVDGRALTEDDLGQNVVMIEENLAIENNLSVGDKVSLLNTSDEEVGEVEVVGIYKSSSEINEMAYKNLSMLPYNQIYAPYTVVNKIKGDDYENAVDSMKFYLNDPINVDAFIEEGNKTSIDFDIFKLDANNAAYESMMEPIENVASFSTLTLILVMVFGGAILALIIMLSIKDRTNEIGILMALGEKRIKIVMQLLTEVIIVLVLAISVSGLCGSPIGNIVGNKLVQQEINSSKEEQQNQMGMRPNGGNKVNIAMGMGTTKVEAIDTLDVSMNGSDFSKMATLSLFLACIATLIPSISIMRLKPKTILSKHN